ncbi:hypothetical protein CLU79DRAFT_757757 [Phycomyces nitens]|nr:hypothetical protein CLU79DRAFT_757757 [Phycomyces nitens]
MISFQQRYRYISTLLGLGLWFYTFDIVSSTYAGIAKGLGNSIPRYEQASFSYGNKLYAYGGRTSGDYRTSIFSSVSLSSEADTKGDILYEIVPQSSPGPKTSYSRAIVLNDKHTVVLFTGLDDSQKSSNETIHTYTYDFQAPNDSWKRVYGINSIGPGSRIFFTVTLAPNGKIFLYGGSTMDSAAFFNDLWSFDPISLEYVNLTQSNQMYMSGHTATILPNGQIVFFSGGFSKSATSSTYLPSLNEINIYDTNTNTWIYINATRESLEGRIYASSVLGPDNKTIILFGGSDIVSKYFNDVLLLDTTTWVWTRPIISGDYPAAYSHFIMGFIAENLLAIVHENLKVFPYKDITILGINDQATSNYAWLSGPNDLLSLEETSNPQSKINRSKIAGIAVGSILLALILGFWAWKSFKDPYYLPNLFQGFIWDPRDGEPIWTEIFRLAAQLILAFIFLAYLVFSIRQVLESPTTSITIRTIVPSVQIADIRFCFEGWDASENLDQVTSEGNGVILACYTDRDVSCLEFLTKLDMTVHIPIFEDSTAGSYCYLFSPPSWFRLGNTGDGSRNGTRIRVIFHADQGVSGIIRITQYPPGMNPNIKIYNINITDVSSQMSDQDVNEWATRDMQGKSDSNTFTMYTNYSMNMKYQIKDHQYLENTGWNRIGFLPRYNSTPEISSSILTSDSSVQKYLQYAYSADIIGSLNLYPEDYSTVIEQDQKIHTIINSLGSVGGILSLIVGIQVWLFGFRPKSPWGVVQHFSRGFMRRSLRTSLQKKFKTNTPIPFVDIDRTEDCQINRTKTDDGQTDETKTMLLEDQQDQKWNDLQDRVYLMESRMKLTERLFEAYYLDTEIFKELGSATGNRNRNAFGSTKDKYNTPNDTDKV